MTPFDYAFLGLLGVMVLLGLWRGLVSELIALGAWIVAFILARYFGSHAAALFEPLIAEPIGRQIAGFALIFVGVLVLTAVLRFVLRELLKAAGLRLADRFLGAIFGFTKGLLIALCCVGVGGMLGFSQADWWAAAKFAPPLETAVIAVKPWLPEAVANRIRFR